ncbi:MAG: RNA polymerase sigma factor [Ignavibacteriales bacterium]|nr:RNA polymerase sigma factor [Ignavibacteriales bacterium]
MTAEENQLILKARQGNTAAFEELIYRYDKHVLAISYKFRNNREDAKDIYQEVFMRVYKGLKYFEGKSEFSTWLYRIVTNVCISFKRSQKKHEHVSINQDYDDDDNYSPVSDSLVSGHQADDQLNNNEISKKMWLAVETLSPQQKLAFTYKYLNDHKIKEIAVMMNCSEGAIKKYLFTATRKLREQLKHLV